MLFCSNGLLQNCQRSINGISTCTYLFQFTNYLSLLVTQLEIQLKSVKLETPTRHKNTPFRNHNTTLQQTADPNVYSLRLPVFFFESFQKEMEYKDCYGQKSFVPICELDRGRRLRQCTPVILVILPGRVSEISDYCKLAVQVRLFRAGGCTVAR